MSSGREGSLFGVLREAIETIIIAVVLTFFLITFVAESFVVNGHSMEPTLHDGERVIVNKLVYRFRQPRRGEIVVFRYPKDPAKDFIKRVVAVPGDTVEMRRGKLFLNGQPVDESYAVGFGYGNFSEKVVPPGHYFVLGDNRSNSEDSRMFGFVAANQIIGKAALLFWPLSRARVLGAGLLPGVSLENEPSLCAVARVRCGSVFLKSGVDISVRRHGFEPDSSASPA